MKIARENPLTLVLAQGPAPREVNFEVTESAMAPNLGRVLENLA